MGMAQPQPAPKGAALGTNRGVEMRRPLKVSSNSNYSMIFLIPKPQLKLHSGVGRFPPVHLLPQGEHPNPHA